jgi:hypothetical protein
MAMHTASEGARRDEHIVRTRIAALLRLQHRDRSSDMAGEPVGLLTVLCGSRRRNPDRQHTFCRNLPRRERLTPAAHSAPRE